MNCRAVVELAAGVLPPMVGRGRGGFVVMSSVAGLQGSPSLALYAATKAFGRTLAESLWAELRPHGVDVVSCVAGAVRTPGLDRSDRLRRGPVIVPGRFMRAATGAMPLLPRRTAVTVMARAGRDLSPS